MAAGINGPEDTDIAVGSGVKESYTQFVF